MTKKSKKLGVKITPTLDASENFNEEPKETDNIGKTSQDDLELKDKTLEDVEQEGETLKSKSEEDILELKTVCELLDKLSLEMLILMEQQIQQKLKIETTMTEGEAHLAKSRYILGHKNVSALQLPTENSNDLDPAVTLLEVQNDETYFGKPRLKLNIEEYTKTPMQDQKNNKNIQDPMNWFGVLVPRNLHLAQSSFRTAIEFVVDCANTQTRLHQVCVKIHQLREIKKKLSFAD